MKSNKRNDFATRLNALTKSRDLADQRIDKMERMLSEQATQRASYEVCVGPKDDLLSVCAKLRQYRDAHKILTGHRCYMAMCFVDPDGKFSPVVNADHGICLLDDEELAVEVYALSPVHFPSETCKMIFVDEDEIRNELAEYRQTVIRRGGYEIIHEGKTGVEKFPIDFHHGQNRSSSRTERSQ